MLITDGEVDDANLKRCRLNEGDMDAILRQHGHQTAADVRLAVFETKGVVSVFSNAEPPGKSRPVRLRPAFWPARTPS